MKRLIACFVCISLIAADISMAMAYDAQCLTTTGKFSDCKVEISDATLSIAFKTKKWKELNKVISGSSIESLSCGEYARRRVGESIGSALLLGPLALFMLFSKKKRDNFGVEYTSDSGSKESVLVQIKKKYGFALGQQLKTLSGKDMQCDKAESGK